MDFPQSESQVKEENDVNGFIVDVLEIKPVKTEFDQNLANKEIIDLNLKSEIEIEVKTEIDDFETEKHYLPQIIGGKRKNDEIKKIKKKN